MQTNAFLHLPLFLNTPYSKNSAIMIRNDFKLRLNMWYLHVQGAFPLPDGISLNIITNTSGEGPTHLKATVKG